jgi:hypothetical protein
MAKTRKTVRMIVEVSVPKALTVAAARREVRSMINDQCEFHGYVPGTYDEINMKVRKIGPVK